MMIVKFPPYLRCSIVILDSYVYIALIDAKKAFDKVWHEGLYREMHKMNIYGDNWLMFKEWNQFLVTNNVSVFVSMIHLYV
jgi:hypothetical protein